MATKTINVYVGRQQTKEGYDQCICWFPKRGTSHGIVNVSLLTQNIKDYDVNNIYNVVINSDTLLSNNETLLGKAGKEWFKATSTRTYPSTVQANNIQLTDLMDMIDMFKTLRDAQKANLNISIIRNNRICNLVQHMTNVLSQRKSIIEVNYHNPKTIGTAISYIRNITKNITNFDLVYSEYMGSDKAIKLYKEEPITVQLNSLLASDLRAYLLKDPEVILNEDGIIDFAEGKIKHNNSLLNIIGKVKEQKFIARLSSSRSYNQIISTFELKTRTLEKDGIVVTETYIPRTVHGITTEYVVSSKKHKKICETEQEFLPCPKSFVDKNNKLISYYTPVKFGKEVLDAFELITGYKPATSKEALDWYTTNALTELINFNSKNYDFSYNQAEVIIKAIRTLENYFKGKLADSITFRKLPNEVRFYSDSERADNQYLGLLDDEDFEAYCNGFEDEITLDLSIAELYDLDVKDTANLVINVKLSR